MEMTMVSQESKPSAGSVGEAMERLAESFLMRQGLRFIARNHRCRYGEIDLILREAAMLVFVEVRFRRSTRFGSPAETVDVRKQRRLIATANHYLQSHPSALACRFDVVAISGQNQIQWIKHAFTADSS
jgi:putative endonuclease